MRKLPKSLLKFYQPTSRTDEAYCRLIWAFFKFYVTGEGRESISEAYRKQLMKEILGDIFGIPENKWRQFTRIYRRDPNCPKRAMKELQEWCEKELAKKSKPGPSKKVRKPPKQKLTKVLVRRHSQSELGVAATTETLLVPARAKV